LAALAGDGRALELAIGTGRIALPLKELGVEVVGIDASEAMIERLRKKPGGEDIPVHVGDFADVDVEGEFDLVFIVFNTFFALLRQDDQIRCLQNVAEHLTEDGVFVIEAFVPNLSRFHEGQRVGAMRVESDRVVLEVSHHRPVEQRVDSTLVALSSKGVELFPLRIRYCWPSELDLMARVAGLELRSRWGGWNEEPFTAGSGMHVSVYRRR
jgi:SAM-dependent methyltransferase